MRHIETDIKTGARRLLKMPGKDGRLLNGITRRWMFSNIFVFAIIIVLFVSVFAVSIYGYYYTSVQNGLETKAQTATDFFAAYITKTYAEYYDSAYQYATDFEDADTIELQFINTSGKVVVSSYSTPAGTAPGTPDVEQALNCGKISVWQGRDRNTGERIVSVSAPMIYTTGDVIGIMRYATSLRLVDHEVMVNSMTVGAGGVVLMLLIVLTNMFFLNSVVRPVRDMTSTAQRIAEGSYGVQIPKDYKYKDEIAELVDAINEMSLKISQAERTQTEFISSVSHELRTPLTAITGWAETLSYDPGLDSDARRGVSIMLKESQRLTKMVEELLDFTRMQDGRFTLNVEPLDVGAELEDAIVGYGELLRQEDITVEYVPYDGDLPLISGDGARLRQVFLNLMDNAAKYGRAGKRIVVSLTCSESDLVISIRDYGPGIPEDELEKVKEKFYKGKSKERGSGIGLAVCDEIVKYHGGALVLRNAPDGGLIAEVRLPLPETK